MTDTAGGFSIDETPLRNWILKAYHEKRKTSEDCLALSEAIRELLTGPLEETSAARRYYFEGNPDSALWLFMQNLGAVAEGLDREIYDPLLTAVAGKGKKKEGELPPNLSVYVASLAGPIALKKRVDETVVCALVSAALLTLSKLGRTRVEALLHGEKK